MGKRLNPRTGDRSGRAGTVGSALAHIEEAVLAIEQIVENGLGNLDQWPEDDDEEISDSENALSHLKEALENLESAVGHLEEVGIKADREPYA